MDVVFLHGWLMGPDLWDAQVAALDGIADTHTATAPAHGTPPPPEGFDMAAWADLIMNELDQHSIERAIFVGHSMGGLLTQQIRRDHPDRVLGIGLIGTAARAATTDEQKQFAELMDRTAGDWRALAPTVADLLIGSSFLTANPEWLDHWTAHVESYYDLTAMKRLIAAINQRPDYTPTTSRIDVPTTVIHGTDDVALPLDLGQQLASLVPDARLVEVEGAGHAPPMERPAPVSSAIQELVQETDRVMHQ